MPCLLQVPKCFVPIQIFWASPKIWLHLVPLQKLLCRHKNQFYWMQIIFLSSTKCLRLPQYENKFLVWHKKFGPAQNILGPLKGQGIRIALWFDKIFKSVENFPILVRQNGSARRSCRTWKLDGKIRLFTIVPWLCCW